MTYHITVVPASTAAGKATIRALLQSESKPFVRAIYRDTSKAPSDFIRSPSFEAVKGDIVDEASLDFSDSNAVFYIPPPTHGGLDQGQWATETATNVKKALKRATSVKKLVLHSAVGAHHNYGIVSLV